MMMIFQMQRVQGEGRSLLTSSSSPGWLHFDCPGSTSSCSLTAFHMFSYGSYGYVWQHFNCPGSTSSCILTAFHMVSNTQSNKHNWMFNKQDRGDTSQDDRVRFSDPLVYFLVALYGDKIMKSVSGAFELKTCHQRWKT